MEMRSVVSTLVILVYIVPENSALSCYECSDTFKRFWEPKDCETNVTNVPTRLCNAQQPYCLVKSVSVKGFVTEITRDCTEECRYGCEATSFGLTRLACVSCCDTDNCNTGNGGHRSALLCKRQNLLVTCLLILNTFITTWLWGTLFR